MRPISAPAQGQNGARTAHTNGNGKGRITGPALTVVIPSRNEKDNVEELVARLNAVAPSLPLEILFVDDSDDDTPQAVRTASLRSKRPVRLLHRVGEERTGGLGGAVLEGMRAARAPWVCVMDADLQHPPEVIEDLVMRTLEGDVDVVVASRFCDQGGVGEFGPLRRLVSRTSTAVAGMLFRGSLRNVTDPMSGFFMVRVDALDLDSLQPHGFKILLEILVRTRRIGVAEVPFTFGERFAGESKASAREGLRYLTHLWRLRLGELTARVGRFGLVGLSGLVVNTLVLAALSDMAGLWYLAAAALATQVSTAWNFALTELWVFGDREHVRTGLRRLVMFFAVNNVALALRAPLLVGLTDGLGMHYLASNFLSLVAVFLVRFTAADLWIWKSSNELAAELSAHNYDIHGIVSVASQVRLPELERFRIAEQLLEPTIRVRTGAIRQRGEEHPERIRYVEWRGAGFAAEIQMGSPIEVTASKLLKLSPHVLYTNVVEPLLRWTFVGQGYALVHAACMAHEGHAFLITARTDTGKTTTCLKTLDSYPYAFVSDDLTLLTPDGRVLTYPKPLTISRHTLQAVKRPRLSRRERFMLIYQSRLHSKSGRWFGLLLAKLHLPAATMNAIVQLLVPPPKYQFDRLVPHAELAPEAKLAGMVIIQRGGEGGEQLERDEALTILLENCDDAYGFPPYPQIEHFLHSRNGDDLLSVERQIIESAMGETPATLLKSESRDWYLRLPEIVEARVSANGNGNGHARSAAVAATAPATPAS